jgi:hypothetical protein
MYTNHRVRRPVILLERIRGDARRDVQVYYHFTRELTGRSWGGVVQVGQMKLGLDKLSVERNRRLPTCPSFAPLNTIKYFLLPTPIEKSVY